MVVGKRDFTSGSGSGLCSLILLKEQVGKSCHEGVPTCLSTQLVAVLLLLHTISLQATDLPWSFWDETAQSHNQAILLLNMHVLSNALLKHFSELKITFLINNGVSFQRFSSLLATCSKHSGFSLPVAVNDIQEFDFPRGSGYRHQGDRTKPV